MSQYFDKNFFKFLVGFLAILAVSFVLLMFAKAYQSTHEERDMGVVYTIYKIYL